MESKIDWCTHPGNLGLAILMHRCNISWSNKKTPLSLSLSIYLSLFLSLIDPFFGNKRMGYESCKMRGKEKKKRESTLFVETYRSEISLL